MDGLIKPVPPNLAGRANNSLSVSEGAHRPVRLGISLELHVAASGD